MGNEFVLVPTDLDLTSLSRFLYGYGQDFSMTHLFLILSAESFILWGTAEERRDALAVSLSIWENNRRIYLAEGLQESSVLCGFKGNLCRKRKKEKKK